jgi:hypothetical protein
MSRSMAWVGVSCIAAALAAVGLWAGSASADGGAAPEREARTLLLMHYMPWYTTPEFRAEWGGHWTGWEQQHDPSTLGEDGLPDIWSHYHPLIGTYDSTDERVVECQLLQMKLAGVDGVIADWYGISDLHDYDENHAGTEVLFAVAGRLGMDFAACFEDRTVEELVKNDRLEASAVESHLADTFRWMDEHWFGADHHVRVDGRPLLLNFGPIYVKDSAVWDGALGSVSPRPLFFALHHLWQKCGADGGFTWVHQKVWEGDPDREEIERRLEHEYTYFSKDPEKMIVSALPGFHDIYEHSYGHIDHRGGATLRESLEFCVDGDWPIVQLVTWNDYGEGTIIEPTHEFGYLFLEIIQDVRRRELGDEFTFTKDDLRLPARLLALRRAGDAPRTLLDRIARLLADGDCDRAREMLDRAEAG